VRDNVVETMEEYRVITEIAVGRLLRYFCLSRSKYYEWKTPYGLLDCHNGKILKANWLFEHEKEAIIEYAKKNLRKGPGGLLTE
jgi:hypothetical protein